MYLITFASFGLLRTGRSFPTSRSRILTVTTSQVMVIEDDIIAAQQAGADGVVFGWCVRA